MLQMFCNINCTCVRKNQHYALIFTTPLLCVVASTRFGISLPSSDSVSDPSELHETQIEWAVYLKYITDLKISVCITYHVEES
jgi:hypothetical protein